MPPRCRRGRRCAATPRRPQTLGKTERFWGTLWRECVETGVFVDLADARTRLAHFFDHYNFQRPHQGCEGLVPADRFFHAAPEVRRALEARIAANALALARDGAPKVPFYVAGQTGGRPFSVHAEGERLILIGPDGHELAWVEHLSELAAPLRALIEEELRLREFHPQLQRLVAVSTFSTPSHWTVETDKGPLNFILKTEEDIRRLGGPGEGRLLITTSHGLQIFVNDRLVHVAEAREMRPGVKEKGLHPTGLCGFRFEWPAGTAPRAGDRVEARVEGDINPLSGSPRQVGAAKPGDKN